MSTQEQRSAPVLDDGTSFGRVMPRSAIRACITSRPATGRWSFYCTGFPGVLVRLAAAGRAARRGRFSVVAPDTRGYNLSSKPEGFEDYGVDLLADDIRGLIEERGAKSARLVGHDWGGSIAWTVG